MNNNPETGFLHIVLIYMFSISKVNMHLCVCGGGGVLGSKFLLNICFHFSVRQFYFVYFHYYKINILASAYSLATQ